MEEATDRALEQDPPAALRFVTIVTMIYSNHGRHRHCAQ